MPDWLYTIVGYWVRRDACRLAAQAFRRADAEEGYTPIIWSMSVFFERYLLGGANDTLDDFGPKAPVELNAMEAAPASAALKPGGR